MEVLKILPREERRILTPTSAVNVHRHQERQQELRAYILPVLLVDVLVHLHLHLQ